MNGPITKEMLSIAQAEHKHVCKYEVLYEFPPKNKMVAIAVFYPV